MQEKTCGLYYKHVTIVNEGSSIVSKGSFKLIDDPRVFIYDRRRFMIQATGLFCPRFQCQRKKKLYTIDNRMTMKEKQDTLRTLQKYLTNEIRGNSTVIFKIKLARSRFVIVNR
jgi:hypothetical protein